ncbi:GDP-mannose 4,6-dehydratase [Amycolatopsis solani]|uniref:GDP-mannose 4,6-dehydratase n=1 Tax=Amycolatopsis solani TaxID=3028615 RepID=UPI0025B1005D|nr:GDP-mannose 4,6-dehydratase [Amycolatopsis sp. MEP2-6]
MQTALITGITGQDGSYLTELLLAKGYEVHGIIRRASTFTTTRIDHLYRDPVRDPGRLILHYGDLTDGCRLANLLAGIAPDEVYHLAAQSHVRVSFDEPVFTGDTTGLGTTRLLETIRMVDLPCRFYQASSSEMFGETPPPQNEESPLRPQSPYAAAKTYAYWVTRNYREGYGMFAVNGILFNHESPRRGETFVTRKITRAAALIRAGKQDVLHLGNLDATRDWGYAPEYVEAMWLMLQQDRPDDYVVATGKPCTVREFLEHAFTHAGLDWHDHVRFDDRYLRPVEVPALIGDPAKAERELGWRARVHAPELARLMVDADLAEVLEPGAPRPRTAVHDTARQAQPVDGPAHAAPSSRSASPQAKPPDSAWQGAR